MGQFRNPVVLAIVILLTLFGFASYFRKPQLSQRTREIVIRDNARPQSVSRQFVGTVIRSTNQSGQQQSQYNCGENIRFEFHSQSAWPESPIRRLWMVPRATSSDESAFQLVDGTTDIPLDVHDSLPNQGEWVYHTDEWVPQLKPGVYLIRFYLQCAESLSSLDSVTDLVGELAITISGKGRDESPCHRVPLESEATFDPEKL